MIKIMMEETIVLKRFVHDYQGEKNIFFGNFHLLGFNCLEPKVLLDR